MKYLALLILTLSFNVFASETPSCFPEFPYADGAEFVEFTSPGETCFSNGEQIENRTDRELLCFFSFAYSDGMGPSGFEEVSLHDIDTCKLVR